MTLRACIAVALLATSAHAQSRGYVFDHDLFSFPLDDIDDTTLIHDQITVAGGSVKDVTMGPNGEFLYATFDPSCCSFNYIVTIDVQTGVAIDQNGVEGFIMGSITYNPATDALYYLDLKFDSIWEYDPNGVDDLIGCIFDKNGDHVSGAMDMAFDNNGELYLVAAPNFYKIDLETTTALFIADIGGSAQIDFDPETNVLYGAYRPTGNDNPYFLVSIDVETGDLTTLGEFTDEHDFNGGGFFPRFSVFPAQPCLADCNDDGVANILDFVCFQQLFQAGDMAADCDENGFLNIADFVCFQGQYQLNCN